MGHIQTLSASNCSVSKKVKPIEALTEDGLFLLSRLDLSGSLSEPDQLRLVTESSALSALEYLNVSRCSVDDTSLASIFNSPWLRRVEVLGLASLIYRGEKMLYHSVPTKTTFGLNHKLKAIDLRNN